MNLIDLSIRRPVFAWVLMFALIVFGAICMNRMGISQLPDVDFPIVSVSVDYEGAAPEVVEAELLDPIEERLLAIEGIKEMRSSARQGSGSVTLEFDINRNVDVVLQEVQTALSRMRWPPGVDPATIRKQNPEEDPIIILSVYGEAPLKEMINWTENYLLDQVRFLEGVGEVGIGGFSQRNLRIWVDPKKLSALYLTLTDVVDAISTQHLESAAGQFTEGERELRVRWLGEATNVEDVANIQILRRGGQRIHDRNIFIRDVARVEDGLSDIRRVARVDGRQAVSIQVRKQRGTNEVTVANEVRQKLDSIKDTFPKGFNYRVNVDFTRPTDATVNLTIEKLWVAALITILVCFLFLGSISAAVNILFSIPTSIVGTFVILYFSGFTLNLFTLLALTLSISIVVDDAIMLLENIVRHYRMGKPSAKAASDGSKEVLPAAVAATLAVIAVFLPVVFMDGIIGKFFFQFGVTMSAAVSLSLLEAVTITPMRAAALLSSEPKVSKLEHWLDELFEKFAHSYQKVLHGTLRFKYVVVIGSLVFFVVSLFLVAKVRQEFVPAQDQDFIIISAQMPPGTSLEKTSREAEKIEAILKQDASVEGFVVSVGGGGGGSNVNQVFLPVALKARADRQQGHLEIMNKWRAEFRKLKDMRVSMRDISARNLSSGRQNPVAINLRGPDLNVLFEKSQVLMERLEKENLAVDLDSDFRKGIPELVLTPDRKAMAARGVSVEDVGRILSAGVGGLREGRYTADGRRYDIRFKFLEDQIQKPEDFKKLYVRNNFGNLIPLSQLVKIEEQSAIQGISRVNRQRAISVFGNLAPGQSQAKVLDRASAIAKEILPTGYSFALEGASAGFADSFKSLYSAMLVGILVAYLILAIQFNSFIHPVSVLVALPFSVTGALVALWMFDVSLNLFSFIGLIVLMGIAKKNSILLVEFTNQVRYHGEKDISKALLQACPIRLRPILMTSVATVAAAMPLVIGHGIGSETRVPMGLSIIGGTIVSTLLTLFVVPALYLMLSPLESKKKEVDL
ncbi:Multidrug resistance protein MdtC [Bdellovibrio bacteriovorus]|uniref:efflux RND transporter permease subunit n=1 Tax=Bdellovibrio bacteriovorus TaxID=959 RepID=UPI00045BFDFF|nr:efflux RND transporter permease subunit [Bdellovibrio bacteriovorus]AHZ86373.1 acriflavin resistance protein [Bdellovibrio bacteriovorus]BEV67612.1 Multidrug resistance protein MdtC [Bdellovibrio bacteriovorus]